MIRLHPAITDALMRHQIDSDEFFSRTLAPPAVEARRDAINGLAAAGFSNRKIASMVKRNICTVRYWLNSDIREHRIAYKAGTRMEVAAP